MYPHTMPFVSYSGTPLQVFIFTFKRDAHAMKPHALLATLLLAAILATDTAHAQQDSARQAGWRDLFNGRDLSGWAQLNGEARYTVEDGAIVGTTVPGTPNSFLATEQHYGDFVLELEVMVDPALNSGIQVRSNSLPDYMNGRVHGYQIEIDPALRAWSGGIYDEARRGWLYPMELNEACRTAFQNGLWNRYTVEAIGPSLRTWVNGVPCADLVDDMTLNGFIALQVHSIDGEAMAGKHIRWRNIRIKTDALTPRPWTDIPVVNLIPNILSPQEQAQGWKLLFDGNTTSGWRGAHKDAFPAGGWKVEGGALVVEASGGGESQGGGDIVTVDEYGTFELSLDFMLTEGANSGIKYFITEGYDSGGSAIGLEYQLLDDQRHPDAMEGAAGNRTLGSLYDLIPAHANKIVNPPGQWNHARLVVEGVRIDEWLNRNSTDKDVFRGAHVEHWLNQRKVLEYERGTPAFDALVARSKYVDWEGFGRWQAGHILLQDHGNEVHFRSIKIRELPATATHAGRPGVSLFNGKDLTGWIVPEGDNGHWKVVDGVIDYDALSEAEGAKDLWTEAEYGDFELTMDWRIKEYSGLYAMPNVLPSGLDETDADGTVITVERPNADSGVYLRGSSKSQVNIWGWPIGSGEVYGYRTDAGMPPAVRAGVTPRLNADNPVGEWNTFVITLRGDRLTVELNGQVVIEDAELPGVPERGRIALQHHGHGKPNPASSLVQFRNIFIRAL